MAFLLKQKFYIPFLLGLLFLSFPFEKMPLHLFRPFSRSMLYQFKAQAPFEVILSPFFEKHIHLYFSEMIILLLLFFIFYFKRKHPYLSSFNYASLALFLFWLFSFLSLLTSFFSTYYYQYFNLLNLALIFSAFHIVRLFFLGDEKAIKYLFITFAFLSAFECLVGLYQFFFQAPLGIPFLGEVPLHKEGTHLATFPIPAKASFLQALKMPLQNKGYLIRAYGTFLHPNLFGEFLAISLLISYTLFIEAKKKRAFLAMIFLIFLQIFSLFLTFSRAASIGWVISTLCFFLLLFCQRKTLNSMRKKRLFFLFSLLFLGFLTAIFLLFPHLLERGGFFNYNPLVSHADKERLLLQKVAFNMFKSHPIFGMGYNCFTLAPSHFFKLESEVPRIWVHNIYLLIGSETGFLGLASFLFFLISLLKPLKQVTFTPTLATLLAIFIGFIFVGLCDFYFLIVQEGKLMFFLFCGLLSAASYKKETKASFSSPSLFAQLK